jgi:hypothetical protein
MTVMAGPASSQQAETVGQISGVAAIPGKGTLAGVTAQLRDLTTKQLVGVVKTNASGQFVFIVDHPGTFVVEILDEKGAVIGTTAPIVLSAGAMIVSGVAVAPTAGGAAALAGAAAAGQGESGTAEGAVGAMAGGGVSSNIFMPSLLSVSSAATGSGVAVGAVPSRGTASPSR